MNRFTLVTAGALVALSLSCLHSADAQEERSFDVGALLPNADAYPLETVVPVYPIELRQRGCEGQALVEVVVAEDGRMDGLSLISASEPAFGESAMKAVSKWLFEPGRRRGLTVRQVVVIPFDFKLEGIPARRGAELASL